jgi:CHAT domain/NACHT domain
MDYLDFALLIGAGEDGSYSVTVLDSPGGEGRAHMEIPLQLQAFLKAIEGTDSEGGRSFAPVREEAPTQSLSGAVQEIGQALFASLIQESVQDCYHTSLALARKEGKGLRLRLRIEPPELARLPWEFLHEGKTESDYLSLSKRTPVVRHLEVALPIESLTLKPPIRLLGMVGARHGLDVAAEQKRMAQAIEHLTDKGRGAIQLSWVEGHTWRALSDALERGPWHAFHFIGHGGYDEQTGEGLVLLEKEGEEGVAQRFPARDLGSLLADHPSLKLAVLNSCEGARASATNVFSSGGAILASRGIPAVVSMQYEITDRAAVEFSRAFYDSLADGKPVDEAVSDARKAIKMALGETVEWGTPVLHMRAKDGVLFRLDLDLFRQPDPAAAPPVPAPAPKPSSLPGPADAQGLQILLRKVRQFWIEGVLERSIERSARLDLGMEKVEGAVASPWGSLLETPNTGSEPVTAGRSFGEVFAEMGGSLLILGEPGSGKTVTLLELARDLLARAEQDPTRPIPVVFTLSSWTDPGREIAGWLADELAAKYVIPKKVGQSWVSESRLLPLFDGLDEVRAEARSACVEAINAFLQQSLTGVVVCCRLKEYLELPARLALNGAIRLQPLSRGQVLAYLAAAGERLAALNQLLQQDSAMLVEARSPLMLSLMVQAYQDLPVEALAIAGAESLADRRKKLMDAYVARMFRRAGLGETHA